MYYFDEKSVFKLVQNIFDLHIPTYDLDNHFVYYNFCIFIVL